MGVGAFTEALFADKLELILRQERVDQMEPLELLILCGYLVYGESEAE